MAKIKFTKTELKNQQDAKKQFERFLPTLQLKKQQLQMEVRQSADALEANLEAQKELQKALDDRLAESMPMTTQLGTSFHKGEIIESGFMV